MWCFLSHIRLDWHKRAIETREVLYDMFWVPITERLAKIRKKQAFGFQEQCHSRVSASFAWTFGSLLKLVLRLELSSWSAMTSHRAAPLCLSQPAAVRAPCSSVQFAREENFHWFAGHSSNTVTTSLWSTLMHCTCFNVFITKPKSSASNEVTLLPPMPPYPHPKQTPQGPVLTSMS